MLCHHQSILDLLLQSDLISLFDNHHKRFIAVPPCTAKSFILKTSGITLIRSATCQRYMSFIIIQFFRDGDAILGNVNSIVNELKFGSRQTKFIHVEHIKPIMPGFLGHI